MKRVTAKFLRNFAYRKCVGIIGVAVEKEEKLYDEVEIVSEFTYCGDRLLADEGCEAAVTARTRCGGLGFGSALSCFMVGDIL